MACPGSRLVGKELPVIQPDPKTKAYRDEGDAAHYMAEKAFNGEFTLEEMIDRKAPNGVYMTLDMMEHIENYLSALPEKSPVAAMEVESNYHGENFEVNGRADHLDYHAPTGILHVGDLKFGWSIVEAENNWTLVSHAVGWCLANPTIKPTSIIMSIYQPRPYHRDGKVRRWHISYDHLMILCSQIFTQLSNPTDDLQTGPNCYKCPGLAACPAARKAALNAVDVADKAHDDTVNGVDLSLEIDNLTAAASRIKSRLSAIEELAKHNLKHKPNSAPGYSVEHQYGNLKWHDHVTLDLLKLMTGRDLSKPKILTPLQAIKAGVDEKTVRSMSHEPSTGLKLVRISADDKAKKLFSPKGK